MMVFSLSDREDLLLGFIEHLVPRLGRSKPKPITHCRAVSLPP